MFWRAPVSGTSGALPAVNWIIWTRFCCSTILGRIARTIIWRDFPGTRIAADPLYLDVSVPPGVSFSCSVEPGHNVFAYVFGGEGDLGKTDLKNGNRIEQPSLAVFGDGNAVDVSADRQPVRFLLVSGKPLHEPIARYGPFVMNTREEIEQALSDLRNGTFIKAKSS